jgi:hypothetical protein
VLDVGAAPGTDVYAPVDGTIVGISDYVLNGRAYGSRHRHPAVGGPSLVVSLTHSEPDPALTVGRAIAASTTKVGRDRRPLGSRAQALVEVHAGRREPRLDRATRRRDADLP